MTSSLRLIWPLIWAILPTAGQALTSATQAEDYRMHNLWLQTANPAGLSFNSPTASFSVAETGYRFTNGTLRYAGEATSRNGFRVGAESYRRIGTIQLYGRAGYAFESQNNRRWSAMLQPADHLINFGDAEAGRQQADSYLLCGAISVPLGKGWYAGGNLDYQARSGRKNADPRNQNVQTDMTVVPGIIFDGKGFGIGAHGSYRRIVEKIKYTVLSSENYDNHTFYPLWFYLSENLNSGIPSRDYRDEGLDGGVQIWIKGGRYEWLGEGRYGEGLETCDKLPVTGSRWGETERQEFRWNNLLRLRGNRQHTFRLSYLRRIRTGYDNLQLRPDDSNTQNYLDYGRVKRSAIRSDIVAFGYTLLSEKEGPEYRRKIDANADWRGEETLFFVYPAYFSQTIYRIRLFADYTQHFRIRRHDLEIKAGLGYKNGWGHLPEAATQNGLPLPEIHIPQKKELLIHDFRIGTSGNLIYTLEFQYTSPRRKSRAFFVNASARLVQGLSRLSQGACRLHGDLSAGLLF